MLCNRIDDTLPCKANRLRVSTRQGALVCGDDVSTTQLHNMPNVQQPNNVALTPVGPTVGALYVLVVVDPDAPNRNIPIYRYWNHGIFADITPKM
ncbi:hypothetical protein NP493_21g02007 [Ridgeia piscesae]|uniref:Uncharacterized protein n=1 Tax=Ridgeia piscesae TaxID=27915 RepID=A0AAD9PDM3_RIDPI|nr:hypothetical protein NP493_21g02007 [Ridgeia piscesae]